jgi:ribonuclease HI
MEKSGAEPQTTNTRMELQSVIEGLAALKKRTSVDLYTDSEYVRMGLSQWMAGWKRNGWKRKERGSFKEVKNVELWQRLDELVAQHEVRFHRVAGHSGHPENDRCDELAVEAYRQLR